MQAELLQQFRRESAMLEGKDGLAAERARAEHENELKRIEEIKKLENAKTDAEYKLKHAELTKRLELQTAEIQQKADLEKARIEAEKTMCDELQQKEIETRKKTELEILEAKSSRVVPIEKHHKQWWQLRWRPNEAYKLVADKVQLETRKYLAERKDEIIKLQAELSGSEEIEVAICTVFNEYLTTKHGRKARAAATALTEIVQPLCAVFARREHAFEDLIEGLSKLRETKAVEEIEAESAKIISTDDNSVNVLQENPTGEEERQRLQKNAASLIITLCERRISEKQQEQLKKPARKRVRKKPENIDTENLNGGEHDK
ncbi:MAG: hypothetical protein HFE40_05155 [Clostridia bacterium]|nr:hypothetical protein [Clostridia bacterium]